jgi:predicted molibdopterin-dependent oxidoreductase YjgC
VDPSDFLMLVSPDLTNEVMYAAQHFTRQVLGSPNVDSSVRRHLGELAWWTRLLSGRSVVSDLRRSSAILSLSLDPRFAFSVVAPAIRAARETGARLTVIDSRESLLARSADVWLQDESVESLQQAIGELSGKGLLSVLVGPDAVNAASIETLYALARREDVNLLPLDPGANTRGALEMGVFPELLPGGRAAQSSATLGLDDVLAGRHTPKVLYLVGDVPFSERPACETLIVQDLFLPDFPVDVFLPAAGFTEVAGSYLNLEGALKPLTAVESLEGEDARGGPRPDGWILASLAEALGKGFGPGAPEELLKAAEQAVPGLSSTEPRGFPQPEALPLPEAPDSKGWERSGDPRLCHLDQPGLFTHRGVALASKVEGLALLAEMLTRKA